MKYQNKILTALLLIIFTCKGHSQGKNFRYSEKLREYLSIIHSKKTFHGEVLVAKGNEVLFQKAIGSASLANHSPLQKDSKYRIASITKTFTGSLITMAQKEGKLDTYDPAIKYLDGLAPKFNQVTIEHLLTHTSGLPHNEGITDYWKIKSKLQMTPKQVILEINELDLLFKPGEKMHYSSPGYYLLAMVLESVYKDSFKNILQKKILEPLGMNDSGIANAENTPSDLATGYHLISDDSLAASPYRNYSMLKGAGDMYTTSKDLMRWNHSFLSNTLFDERTKKYIFGAGNMEIGSENGYYGRGWYIKQDKPIKYYHGGGTWGFSTYNSFYPKDSLSIIILSNISPISISEVASDIEKIVFGKPFQMPSVRKEIPREKIDLETYLGTYKASNQMAVTVSTSEDNLYAQLSGRPAFEIYPMGNHRFFGKKVDIIFTFNVNDQKTTGFMAEGMGKTFHFIKNTD